MSLRKSWIVFTREVLMGPRTMMVSWIVLFPLLITFVIRLVFGDLIDQQPRLGIVDLGSSSIPAVVAELEEIDLTILDSETELRTQVKDDDLDAGLVLQADFDQAVKSGANPELLFFVGGESRSSTRVILAITAIDLVRGVTGEPAPVEVVTEVVGDGPTVPIEDRLVPMLVLLAVAFAGIFLPASSIIQEKVDRTAVAVLSTPLQVGEYLLAKGVVGFLMSFGVGVLTLLINGGFTAYVAGNLSVIAVGALMSVPVGLLLGSAIGDIQTMFAVWKSGGIIIFAPAVLFLFPSVPRWIAMLFPTYYFLGPLYDMTVDAASLSDVYPELLIGVAISVAFIVLLAPVGRRMEQRLAIS